jgi:hypothetical protein
MTEAEWFDSGDPAAMLEFLRGKASQRKLRLFATACCRRIRHLVTNEHLRQPAEEAERFADGLATRAELDTFRLRAADACTYTGIRAPRADEFASFAVIDTAVPEAQIAAISASSLAVSAAACAAGDSAPEAEYDAVSDQTRVIECAAQCELLRDIIGNPFRAPVRKSGWMTAAVTTLARVIYEERRFEDLPILADALQDAGCDNADVLAHCRGPGPHVRGCWVIDLLLGRQ